MRSKAFRVIRAFVVTTFFFSWACGSWSTPDLEASAALPSSAALTLRFAPAPMSTPEAMAAGREVDRVNDLVTASLAAFTACRSLAPTRVDGSTRIWGPFADDQAPSVRFSVRQSRTEDDAFLGALVLQRGTDPEVSVATFGTTFTQVDVSFDVAKARQFVVTTPALANVQALSLQATLGSARTLSVEVGDRRFEALVVPTATELRVATDAGLTVWRWRPDGAGQRQTPLLDGGRTSTCWDPDFQPLPNDSCALIEGL